MLGKIEFYLKLFACKLNVFYPQLLGFGYLYYKNVHVKKNFKIYNSEDELLSVVNNAIINVPYYKNKYKTPIKSVKEFETTLDFIDKSEVMAHWDNFILPNTNPSKIITGTTGGTSGKPLKLVIPRNRYVFELGTMYTMWENVGWKGHIRAVLRNTKLNDKINVKINPLKREFIFDGFRTTDVYFEIIYNIMKKYGIKYLHAYPSSAYQFSVFLKRKNKDTSIFKAFICGSEALLPEQEYLIKKELGINIYTWYGHSEKLVLGGYCHGNQLIHVEPTYGYIELIDENGNHITEPNKKGEIVGTTLHNKYMPLIRYRTGDYAEYVADYCGDCNRYLTLIKNIEGRWDSNKIYLSDGSYTTITALNMHDDLYTHINGMQYIQYNKGELIIKLIKDESFSKEVEDKFIAFFNLMLGDNCSFQLQFVESIENEKNGKFLPLKQYVKL
ncbi:phenylacetate--CoA ligase family protein [Winogradskyella bathintestinalis]|uniref:Phenylacetate--CoA ligase family protein n=1 Tax=Winogradskyella bathintestinalis TaxID=3035208 RepID=A0ABT7ZSV6_9FLAO|nr:hypothetical protein [Winogradskyella bathintestinalis]MDN3492052.1 hypothetical protein [Winogradskyella bathintestinalis]